MIQLAVAMGNIVMPSGSRQLIFRDLLLRALEPFPTVRDYLIQMRFKPKPRYQAGLFLDLDDQLFEASLVGEMIPQPLLQNTVGRALLDERLGSGFALVAQDERGSDALSAILQEKLAGLPLMKLNLQLWETSEPLVRLTLRPLLTHRDQILLVRPDRYCAAVAYPEELPSMLKRYETLLEGPSWR